MKLLRWHPWLTFAGNETVGVMSSADPASVVTIGVAFREKYRDSVVSQRDWL